MTDPTIQDYLVSTDGVDCESQLNDWQWLLPESFEVWLVNLFGDAFIELPDGPIQHLDVVNGTLETVASSRNDFCDQCENAERLSELFMIPLADELATAGRKPGPNQCYTFFELPVFEGEYEIENVTITGRAHLWSLLGKLHQQLEDIPDGEPVDVEWNP